MCSRTIKMKLKKGAVLNEVNSNTNTIITTVKGVDTKRFGRHSDNSTTKLKKETETNVNK